MERQSNFFEFFAHFFAKSLVVAANREPAFFQCPNGGEVVFGYVSVEGACLFVPKNSVRACVATPLPQYCFPIQ